LRASLIHLTVQPKKKAIIRSKSPDKSQTVTAGDKAKFSGSPDVRIEIEGFGTIYASGPEGDAEAHQEALQDAEKKLAKLTQPYGTQDPDRLQVLREQANGFDLTIEQLESKVAELLDDESADELKPQLAELDARIQERLGRFPAWKKQPPIVSDLRSALEKQRKAIETAIETAEDAFDKAQSAAQAVQKRHGQAEAELKNARLNLDAAKVRLNDLTKDGQSDETRAHDRQEALMAWEAAKIKAKDCETKLNEIPGDPQKTLQKLERQLAALEEVEAKARDEENQAEGRLQNLAAEGAYSKLVACEEKLADLNLRIRREKLRMDATKLLYDTVATCKAAVVAAVAAPVERTATHMLGRIAGPRLGNVRLTENFVPAGVRPEIATEPVELTNLSGGEQEQLFLIVRLALGQVLAKEERQLVVLDDVLNATDTGRLARVLTLLEECADRLQIVILTCHPERYRGLEAATFFNLQEKL
jgi:DNA repair exonuclease SbcCD ATPase subunit